MNMNMTPAQLSALAALRAAQAAGVVEVCRIMEGE